jgi:hypothetical protein
MLCKVIKEKRLLYFYYESDSGKKWRKIRPYMIIPNTKENLELVGLPIEELKQTDKEKRPAGHYLLEKLDMKRFEIWTKLFPIQERQETLWLLLRNLLVVVLFMMMKMTKKQ